MIPQAAPTPTHTLLDTVEAMHDPLATAETSKDVAVTTVLQETTLEEVIPQAAHSPTLETVKVPEATLDPLPTATSVETKVASS